LRAGWHRTLGANVSLLSRPPRQDKTRLFVVLDCWRKRWRWMLAEKCWEVADSNFQAAVENGIMAPDGGASASHPTRFLELRRAVRG
jgi:hypothetical protein